MLSPKDTEAADFKASRDTGKVDSGEDLPIMDDESNEDERSMPKLREWVLSDDEDSSNDEEDF
eukprot:9882255-Ditylum_brightwellii.AAC.1